MNQQKRRVGWTVVVVLIACCMVFARPQTNKGLDSWFCLAKDSQGIVIEYKKADKRFSDTCTSVWFNDKYGYKLYLKNGDSISVCETCVTGSRFLQSEKNKKQRQK